MGWIQLEIKTDPEHTPVIEELLRDAGALSVTMADAADQPLYEPPPGATVLWRDVLVRGLFQKHVDSAALIDSMRAAYQPQELPPVTVTVLEDEDWERSWMDNFKPMRFGDNLWVCPKGATPPDPDATTIILDPGLAFGTGTHPTTALCLSWLDRHAPRGSTLVDYGCGSGILGIAALLLGASRVYGVDNDSQALTASAENGRKNAIDTVRFPLFLPGDFAVAIQAGEVGPVDGVIANILAGPLIDLSAYLTALVKPGGWILLSGVLAEQAPEVMEAYQSGFEFQEPDLLDGWASLWGKRT